MLLLVLKSLAVNSNSSYPHGTGKNKKKSPPTNMQASCSWSRTHNIRATAVDHSNATPTAVTLPRRRRPFLLLPALDLHLLLFGAGVRPQPGRGRGRFLGARGPRSALGGVLRGCSHRRQTFQAAFPVGGVTSKHANRVSGLTQQ